MTYAIIALGGKQYRVREGEWLLVDRVPEKEGATFSSGSYDEVVSGAYPLARYLYIYVNRAPGKPLDPLVHQFLKLVLSREGQEVVVKDGYLPLTVAIVSEERGKIE